MKKDFGFLKKIKLNKLFLKNFTYLSIVEVINILVPFITLPYLVTVLNKENYGLVVFAQSVIAYFLIFQNFGLSTFAIREISKNHNNNEKISEVVSNVFTLKLLFLVFNFVLLLFLNFTIGFINQYQLLFFASFWVCVFDFTFPKWYFQGTENMKWITYVFFVSKITSLCLIFTVINAPSDYFKVPIIYAVSSVLPALFSIWIMINRYKIKFIVPSISAIKNTINSSFTFFVSEVSVAIFANSNKFIIGSVLGMVELSYYDIADKVITVFRNVPLTIVRDSIYPRVLKTNNMNIVKKTSITMGIFSILVIIFLFFFSNNIVTILGGENMLPASLVLKLFSFTILTTHISNYYITVGLWSLGFEKYFRNLMIFSALLFFILIGFLWLLDLLNLYTMTILPLLIDVYLIIHTYYIYRYKIFNEK